MKTFRGESGFGDATSGILRCFARTVTREHKETVFHVEAQIRRYHQAREKVFGELELSCVRAREAAGEAAGQIFSAQKMILEDPLVDGMILEKIQGEQMDAETAAELTGEHFAAMLDGCEDEYLRLRSEDIRGVTRLLVNQMNGIVQKTVHQGKNSEEGRYILAAKHLLPSELLLQDQKHLAGVIVEQESVRSHLAILTQALHLPFLTGVSIPDTLNQREAILDGERGILIVDPDEQTKRQYRICLPREKKKEDSPYDARESVPAITKSGKRISLMANIGSPADVTEVLGKGADGIGLFRTEFLFLGDQIPDEEEQLRIYREVILGMCGRKVIIRVADLGGDKSIFQEEMQEGRNPAMGQRGIRYLLKHPDFFRTQMRALLRAGIHGDLSVLYPMVTSPEEIREIHKILSKVKEELNVQRVPFCDTIEHGIMIETPAAALISDLLAKETDFFCIGTNDLTAFTMAADRQDPAMASLCEPYQEPVQRLIAMTIQNAHRHGLRAGVCGEAAADPCLAAAFIKMGADELSVAPMHIPEIRNMIRTVQ